MTKQIIHPEIKIGQDIAINNLDIMSCNKIMHEVVIGNMLGDGTAVNYAKKSEPTGFSIQLVSSMREYIDHLYNIYKPWTTAKIYDKHLKKDGSRRLSLKTKEPLPPCWGFSTRVKSELIKLKDWRKTSKKPNRKYEKVLPLYIDTIITPRTLAYWFMDDGSCNTASKSLIISTDGFTKNETLILIDILKNQYQVDCQTTYLQAKDQWRIYIPQTGSYTFKNIIEPYIFPCFEYKLNLP